MNKEKEKEKGAAPEQANANQQDNISTLQDKLQDIKIVKINVEKLEKDYTRLVEQPPELRIKADYDRVIDGVRIITRTLTKITGQPHEDLIDVFYSKIDYPEEFITLLESIKIPFGVLLDSYKILKPISDEAPRTEHLENAHSAITKALTSQLQNTNSPLLKEYSNDISTVTENITDAFQTIATHLIDVEAGKAAIFANQVLQPHIKDPLTQPQPIADYAIEIIDAINTAAEIIDENSPHIEAIKAAREKAGIITKNTNIEKISNQPLPPDTYKFFSNEVEAKFNGYDVEGEFKKIQPNKTSRVNIAKKADREKGIIVPIYVQYIIEPEIDPNIRIAKNLNPFDLLVLSSLYKLQNTGRRYIDINDLYKHVTGKTISPNPKQRNKLYESVEKLRFTKIYIDTTEAQNIYRNLQNFKCKDAFLISLTGEYVKKNGGETYAYYFSKEKSLYQEYLEKGKWHTQIPIRLYNVPRLDFTDNNIQLQSYIIKRIVQMKNGTSKNNSKILYETIFNNCNIKTRKQKSDAYKKIDKILKHYVKEQFIKDFKYANGGIEIILKKDDKIGAKKANK